MASITKRPLMTLYSASGYALSGVDSHRVRIVCAEKDIPIQMIELEQPHLEEKHREDFHQLNPYGHLPTLVDRELVLYDPKIIMEYLDERFPHPPLLPVYPVLRARSRLLIHRVEQDWYKLTSIIEEAGVSGAKRDQARKDLLENLLAVESFCANTTFFLSEEFSLVDCSIAPILWRLPYLGIDLPKQAKSLWRYAEKLFQRESFRDSLTELEREFHDA